MQLQFTIDPVNDSAASLALLTGFIQSLTNAPVTPRGEPQTGVGPAAGEPVTGDTEPKTSAKTTAKPAAKAAKPNGKAKPAEVVEDKGDDGEEDDEGPDYGAIRLEIRTRFANWAEQVGMIEGKSLLDSFDVGKFSELDNSQLAQFGKALARMEAEL